MVERASNVNYRVQTTHSAQCLTEVTPLLVVITDRKVHFRVQCVRLLISLTSSRSTRKTERRVYSFDMSKTTAIRW